MKRSPPPKGNQWAGRVVFSHTGWDDPPKYSDTPQEYQRRSGEPQYESGSLEQGRHGRDRQPSPPRYRDERGHFRGSTSPGRRPRFYDGRGGRYVQVGSGDRERRPDVDTFETALYSPHRHTPTQQKTLRRLFSSPVDFTPIPLIEYDVPYSSREKAPRPPKGCVITDTIRHYLRLNTGPSGHNFVAYSGDLITGITEAAGHYCEIKPHSRDQVFIAANQREALLMAYDKLRQYLGAGSADGKSGLPREHDRLNIKTERRASCVVPISERVYNHLMVPKRSGSKGPDMVPTFRCRHVVGVVSCLVERGCFIRVLPEGFRVECKVSSAARMGAHMLTRYHSALEAMLTRAPATTVPSTEPKPVSDTVNVKGEPELVDIEQGKAPAVQSELQHKAAAYKQENETYVSHIRTIAQQMETLNNDCYSFFYPRRYPPSMHPLTLGSTVPEPARQGNSRLQSSVDHLMRKITPYLRRPYLLGIVVAKLYAEGEAQLTRVLMRQGKVSTGPVITHPWSFFSAHQPGSPAPLDKETIQTVQNDIAWVYPTDTDVYALAWHLVTDVFPAPDSIDSNASAVLEYAAGLSCGMSADCLATGRRPPLGTGFSFLSTPLCGLFHCVSTTCGGYQYAHSLIGTVLHSVFSQVSASTFSEQSSTRSSAQLRCSPDVDRTRFLTTVNLLLALKDNATSLPPLLLDILRTVVSYTHPTLLEPLALSRYGEKIVRDRDREREEGRDAVAASPQGGEGEVEREREVSDSDGSSEQEREREAAYRDRSEQRMAPLHSLVYEVMFVHVLEPIIQDQGFVESVCFAGDIDVAPTTVGEILLGAFDTLRSEVYNDFCRASVSRTPDTLAQLEKDASVVCAGPCADVPGVNEPSTDHYTFSPRLTAWLERERQYTYEQATKEQMQWKLRIRKGNGYRALAVMSGGHTSSSYLAATLFPQQHPASVPPTLRRAHTIKARRREREKAASEAETEGSLTRTQSLQTPRNRTKRTSDPDADPYVRDRERGATSDQERERERERSSDRGRITSSPSASSLSSMVMPKYLFNSVVMAKPARDPQRTLSSSSSAVRGMMYTDSDTESEVLIDGVDLALLPNAGGADNYAQVQQKKARFLSATVATTAACLIKGLLFDYVLRTEAHTTHTPEGEREREDDEDGECDRVTSVWERDASTISPTVAVTPTKEGERERERDGRNMTLQRGRPTPFDLGLVRGSPSPTTSPTESKYPIGIPPLVSPAGILREGSKENIMIPGREREMKSEGLKPLAGAMGGSLMFPPACLSPVASPTKGGDTYTIHPYATLPGLPALPLYTCAKGNTLSTLGAAVVTLPAALDRRHSAPLVVRATDPWLGLVTKLLYAVSKPTQETSSRPSVPLDKTLHIFSPRQRPHSPGLRGSRAARGTSPGEIREGRHRMRRSVRGERAASPGKGSPDGERRTIDLPGLGSSYQGILAWFLASLWRPSPRHKRSCSQTRINTVYVDDNFRGGRGGEIHPAVRGTLGHLKYSTNYKLRSLLSSAPVDNAAQRSFIISRLLELPSLCAHVLRCVSGEQYSPVMGIDGRAYLVLSSILQLPNLHSLVADIATHDVPYFVTATAAFTQHRHQRLCPLFAGLERAHAAHMALNDFFTEQDLRKNGQQLVNQISRRESIILGATMHNRKYAADWIADRLPPSATEREGERVEFGVAVGEGEDGAKMQELIEHQGLYVLAESIYQMQGGTQYISPCRIFSLPERIILPGSIMEYILFHLDRFNVANKDRAPSINDIWRAADLSPAKRYTEEPFCRLNMVRHAVLLMYRLVYQVVLNFPQGRPFAKEWPMPSAKTLSTRNTVLCRYLFDAIFSQYADRILGLFSVSDDSDLVTAVTTISPRERHAFLASYDTYLTEKGIPPGHPAFERISAQFASLAQARDPFSVVEQIRLVYVCIIDQCALLREEVSAEFLQAITVRCIFSASQAPVNLVTNCVLTALFSSVSDAPEEITCPFLDADVNHEATGMRLRIETSVYNILRR
ncbi:hypothetical protein KIPB_000780 [Kipferlia bialata]|uniref:Uncharacterized protein n=1 Tax=Kipferlia bialata TaxID=797122 RepID=A0A9K3CN11_9EUKA|nr:hypothetical protein KIPB_000780 [Kipferlia bialata]|eukprot:g780.t1